LKKKFRRTRAVVYESGGGKNYSDVRFAVDDYLIFRGARRRSAETVAGANRDHLAADSMFNAQHAR